MHSRAQGLATPPLTFGHSAPVHHCRRHRAGPQAREEDAASVVHRYTMSNQSGDEWPGPRGGRGECAQVHYEQPVRGRVWPAPGRRTRRVCTGTPQATSQRTSGQAGEDDAASVHRYTTSKQSGDEWPGRGGGRGECVQVHHKQAVRGRVWAAPAPALMTIPAPMAMSAAHPMIAIPPAGPYAPPHCQLHLTVCS